MKGIEKFTKIKTYLTRGTAMLSERLNYGGEVILSRPRGREGAGIDTKKLTRLCLSFGCSFILARGRMAFDTYPLALALASAATSLSPTVALGGIFGALTLDGGIGYIISHVLMLALRFILAFWYVKTSEKGIGARIFASVGAAFSESLYVRMALSVPPAFLLGVYNLAHRGFYFHDLAGLLFVTVFTPVAVFIFSGAFDAEQKGGAFHFTALGAILFSLVFSMRSLNFLGISLQGAAAFFIIMYSSRCRGPIFSAASGALAGLAISPVHAPILAISGMCAGAMKGAGFAMCALASVTLAGGLGFFLIGPTSLLSLTLSSLLGCVLFSFAEAAGILPTITARTKVKKSALIEPISEKKNRALKDELSSLCDSFGAISDIFMNLSSHVRVPSSAKYSELCDSVFDKYCTYCTKRGLCWEREYGSSADMVAKFSSELHRYGRLSDKVIPEQIKARCAALGDIVEEINSRAAKAIEESIGRERAEVVACDYASFSSIISEAIRQNEDDFTLDETESRRLYEAFSREDSGFSPDQVVVWGDRVKHIRLISVAASAVRVRERELKRRIESIAEFPITAPELEICEEGINICFDMAPSFSVEYAHSQLGAHTDACGDSVASFDAPRARSYLMISDGMGTGKLAALSSGICSVFMERMLSSGMRQESAIKILSALLRAKGIECSATLDLAEFDLISGRVCFVKSGGAPSFVLRAGNLFKLESKTVPMGILKSLDAEQVSFSLMEGDVIIMLSDGVCEDFDACAWLPTLLCEAKETDLDALCERIAREAAVRGKSKDDITVAVARVKRGGKPFQVKRFSPHPFPKAF